jgi:peptidoglycan/LPS O-acetylase OafA/YrhL
MNMRNWRPEAQLALITGMIWLGWASLLVVAMTDTVRSGQWGRFAVYLLCAALITFAFMLTLGYAVRQHLRSRGQRRQ